MTSLLPAYVVRRKVMFLHQSVCLSTLVGGEGYPIPGLDGGVPGVPPLDLGQGTPPGLGMRYPPDLGWGTPLWTWDQVPPPSPDLGLGTPPGPGTGYPVSPDLGPGTPPNLAWGTPPRSGTGYPPGPGTGYPPPIAST